MLNVVLLWLIRVIEERGHQIRFHRVPRHSGVIIVVITMVPCLNLNVRYRVGCLLRPISGVDRISILSNQANPKLAAPSLECCGSEEKQHNMRNPRFNTLSVIADNAPLQFPNKQQNTKDTNPRTKVMKR